MKVLLAVLLFALAGKSAAWTFSDGRHPALREPMLDYAIELKNTDENSYYNGVIRLRAIAPLIPSKCRLVGCAPLSNGE